MSVKFLRLLLLRFLVGTTSTIAQPDNREAIISQVGPIDTTVYRVVQVPPAFPGGNEAMVRFIQSASRYPVSLKKGLLVQLKLLIEKDGSISSVQVAYADAADALIQEARRIAQTMPKWRPGSQDGRLLRVYALVPIRFVDTKR